MPTPPPAIDPTVLQQRLDARLPQALAVLREMVGINSFTRNAAGVDRVGDLTAQLFTPLGFLIERPEAIDCTPREKPSLGRHLILTRPGRSHRRIGLVGHLDTVFTEEEEHTNDFHWREVGDRIYGPGTVDIKGGNVLIWMVLSTLHDVTPALFDAVTWVVMFNAAEEGLDSDFGVLERQRLGHDALANLIFEGAGLVNGQHCLITRRKGSVGLHAYAHGRAAHAGAEHQKGANALVQLSEFILRASALTDYARDLTCNVGIAHGGVTSNRVPEAAEAWMEMRAFEPAVLEAALAEVMTLDGLSTVKSPVDGYPARIELSLLKRMPAWPANAGSAHLARLWQSAAATFGLNVIDRGRGGLSDGNFTFDLVPTLDGLGPAGGNLHCATRSADSSVDQEYVLPATFVPQAMMSVLGIERLLREANLV